MLEYHGPTCRNGESWTANLEICGYTAPSDPNLQKLKKRFSQYVFAIVRKSLDKKAKKLLQEIGRITSFLSMGLGFIPCRSLVSTFLTANT